jgi:hypothetical protein
VPQVNNLVASADQSNDSDMSLTSLSTDAMTSTSLPCHDQYQPAMHCTAPVQSCSVIMQVDVTAQHWAQRLQLREACGVAAVVEVVDHLPHLQAHQNSSAQQQ